MTTDPEAEPSMDELAEVGRYEKLEEAQEHGLVILAMREPCWVSEGAESEFYSLHAEPAALPGIRRELNAYEAEREPPKASRADEVPAFSYPAGWGVYGIWALSLVAVFLWQMMDPSLVAAGASSSVGLIGRGEIWRPFTGLFLHADAPHLIGNLMSGLFFGTLVARMIGPWKGWAWILACGAAGNAMTCAMAWPDPFRSIGASTAVFAALGILSGLGFSSLVRQRLRLPWARTAAPVLAGVVLLGWMGGGGQTGAEGTDVMGHMCGFGSGLAAGVVLGRFSQATAGAWIAGTAKAERDGLT